MRSQHFLSAGALTSLIEAARDTTPVSGLTHTFYRYPARFSPKFVRAAIEALTKPGDLILDPFMGGGTTLVEALALDRQAVGIDISSLAAFVSTVKTTLYSERDLEKLGEWVAKLPSSIHMHRKVSALHYVEAHYHRNLHTLHTWRLRKAIQQTLNSAVRLSPPRLESFARCMVLRTAQWALDGRRRIPSIADFRSMFVKHAGEMIEGARQLRLTVEARGGARSGTIHRVTRSTVGLEKEPLLKKLDKPRLVLTSPPYPGLHVLYHRWQVDGRKETPAPFWIANTLDGSGAAYYTMGGRRTKELQAYFANIRESLASVAALCSKETLIVQVLAFSQPSWQLARYLSVADDVGLVESFLPSLKDTEDGRLWRSVPNRKWHADQKGTTNGSREVVLFHRLKA